jgi:hypothetical protein
LDQFPSTTINVSGSVYIKYKFYFKISIIENAICLPAKRLINLLGTFSVVVDIRSTSNASCPTSAIAQFVKQQRWQMLKLLEGLASWKDSKY